MKTIQDFFKCMTLAELEATKASNDCYKQLGVIVDSEIRKREQSSLKGGDMKYFTASDLEEVRKKLDNIKRDIATIPASSVECARLYNVGADLDEIRTLLGLQMDKIIRG